MKISNEVKQVLGLALALGVAPLWMSLAIPITCGIFGWIVTFPTNVFALIFAVTPMIVFLMGGMMLYLKGKYSD